MSSSQSREPQSPSNMSVLLSKLLAVEKENTRLWLRAEMDRLVDPLVDSIFNRLETKLINGMEQYQTCDCDRAQVVNSSFTDQQVHLITQPSPSTLFPSSFNPPLSFFNPYHAKLDNLDADEECDRDECVYRIETTEAVPNLSPSVKKPRMDSTKPNNSQPEVISESSRRATVGVQLKNQIKNQTEKQYITLSVNCSETDCLNSFVSEDQLTQHLREKHSICPSRCLVKNCTHSFENHRILGLHIKQSHQHTTKWHCKKCSKHFTSYNQLSIHNNQNHLLGHFQCSYHACTFTGENRKRVYIHYEYHHKPTLKCQYSGCQFRTQKLTNLKQHQRTHTGIKPYLCIWPKCDYAGTQQSVTIGHIRRHFSSVSNGVSQLDPKDYLMVVHELL